MHPADLETERRALAISDDERHADSPGADARAYGVPDHLLAPDCRADGRPSDPVTDVRPVRDAG